MTKDRDYILIADLVPYERGASLNSYNHFHKLVKRNLAGGNPADDGFKKPIKVLNMDEVFLVRDGASRVAALKACGVDQVWYEKSNAEKSEMQQFEDAANDNAKMKGFEKYPVYSDTERTKLALPDAFDSD